MRKLFIIVAAFNISLSSALACSPPMPIVLQTGNLNRVVNSEAFKRELMIQTNKDASVAIANITFTNGVNINLNNGCNIKGTLKYEPPASNGTCPSFREVIAITECQASL